MSIFVGITFLLAHAAYMVLSANQKHGTTDLDSLEAQHPTLPNRITRHSLMARLFHWVMAGAMLVTAFFPIMGIQFAWVTWHRVAGLVLTGSIVFHIILETYRKESDRARVEAVQAATESAELASQRRLNSEVARVRAEAEHTVGKELEAAHAKAAERRRRATEKAQAVAELEAAQALEDALERTMFDRELRVQVRTPDSADKETKDEA